VDDPSGIDRYDWEIYRSNSNRGGSYSFYEGGSSTGTSIVLPDFNCAGGDSQWFRWRVRAVDLVDNEGSFSDFTYFEIVSP
jgi:hypothetical protein